MDQNLYCKKYDTWSEMVADIYNEKRDDNECSKYINHNCEGCKYKDFKINEMAFSRGNIDGYHLNY